jgi:LEA14-like dessication related protein
MPVIYILLFLAGTALFFLYRYVTTTAEPRFLGIDKLELVARTERNVVILASARFLNPNKFGIDLINVELSAYNKEVKVASVSQLQNLSIGAGKEFVLPLNIDIDYVKLGMSEGMSGIVSSLIDKTKDHQITFKGYAHVKVLGKSFDVPIEFEDVIRLK